MGEIEVFLDEMPGETRGVIGRDGLYRNLFISRDSDVAQHRLGARCVGRVDRVDPGLKGAFVDLGPGAGPGFLPLGKADRLNSGQKIAVEVSAEPRERKAPTLRLLGPAEGEPRLVQSAPTVADSLARLAPGVEIHTGLAALQAIQECEDQALGTESVLGGDGLDVRVERTRAMVAVDIDFTGLPGRDARSARHQANRQGLREAARLIGLRRWGGLVAIDLIGSGQDAESVQAMAREAFAGDPQVVFGPLNRFGVLMLSLPWHRTPIGEVLNGPDQRPSLETRALDMVRRLKFALLSDTRAPRFVVHCAPEEAAAAASWVASLGPRAHLRPDPGMAQGRSTIEEV